MAIFEIERLVLAPAGVVWEVISDVVGYAEVAPNLSKAEILAGHGLGMRRRCYDTRGRGWNEQCIAWEDGRAYSMAVDTSDYPYPFTKMQGTWGLEERPHRICERLLDNWVTKVREREGAGPGHGP